MCAHYDCTIMRYIFKIAWRPLLQSSEINRRTMFEIFLRWNHQDNLDKTYKKKSAVRPPYLCKISLAVQKFSHLILTRSAIKIFICIGSLIFMCKMVIWVFSLLSVAEQEVCWYCNCTIRYIIIYKIQESRISIHSIHKTSSVWK